MIIGIEGPAGAGKTTMARTVAAEIGAVVIEGGAWYRALTYEAMRLGVSLTDTDALIDLARALNVTVVNGDAGETRICLNGPDVTEALYRPDVSRSVAIVARQLSVREEIEPKIVNEVRRTGNVIVVGRHLRKALPEAAIMRITLDDSEIERRYRQREGGGQSAIERNEQDVVTGRLLGNFVDGIVEVDVSTMSPDKQADSLRRFVRDARATHVD